MSAPANSPHNLAATLARMAAAEDVSTGWWLDEGGSVHGVHFKGVSYLRVSAITKDNGYAVLTVKHPTTGEEASAHIDLKVHPLSPPHSP